MTHVDVPNVPTGAQDIDVGYFIQLPVDGDTVTGPRSGQNTGACVGGGGGTFGISDPNAPPVQTELEEGPWVNLTRRVLLHHRHASAFGSGWVLREVSRLYRNGDMATLVHGDGQEEEFRPRARLEKLPTGRVGTFRAECNSRPEVTFKDLVFEIRVERAE
jgi:hypothetical protein